MNHYTILGVNISCVNPGLAAERISRWIADRRKAYVCVAPVSTIVDCQRDPKYRGIVNGAGMVTPDGMPVALIGRWKGHRDVSRTYGPELMLTVCRAGVAKGHKHFIYGGTDAGNEILMARLKEQCPGVNMAGHYAPGMLKVGQKETPDVIERINRSGADILWVGLGSPKQDHWMALHQADLNVPVMVGVGAAFDFLAGLKPQAPRWMQRCCLEWLFRLACEPRRLWKRYLIGNAYFVWLLMLDGVRSLSRKQAI